MNGFAVAAFDLDGTLADTSADLAAALNHALAASGREMLPLDRVRAMVGHGTRALMRQGLAATGSASEADIEAALPQLLEYYAAHIADETVPFPGLIAALDQLRASGMRLAVCTNKPERLSRMLIDALGLADRFDVIVGGDSTPAMKPDPLPLDTAIAQAGGGRAVFVGDSAIDAATARAAGVPFVAVPFGFRDCSIDDLRADVVIDDFAALPAALVELASSVATGGDTANDKY